MNERVYTHMDRTGWGDGPWNDEPDKIQWIDEATNLDCMARRGPMGNWCGYVGVPPGHPYHGHDYDDLDVEVHGGLTYAASCDNNANEASGICHVPEPGRPADVWWLGFDCGHFMDFMPGLVARERTLGFPDSPLSDEAQRDSYKTVEYVCRECEHLAEQCASPKAINRDADRDAEAI